MKFLNLCDLLPQHVIFCFDEAYAEYLENPPDLRPLIDEGRKVICLRTFSKIHGLAALRIGYGYGSTEMIGLLQRARQPFNTNAVAQAAAIGALSDIEWVTQCRQRNMNGLEQIEAGLEKLELNISPVMQTLFFPNLVMEEGYFSNSRGLESLHGHWVHLLPITCAHFHWY